MEGGLTNGELIFLECMRKWRLRSKKHSNEEVENPIVKNPVSEENNTIFLESFLLLSSFLLIP